MLEQQRQQIDAIDRQLVQLFEQRTRVVEEVARIKMENHVPILDSNREAQVIAKVQSYLEDTTLAPEIAAFYTELMRLSREHQQRWMDSVIQ